MWRPRVSRAGGSPQPAEHGGDGLVELWRPRLRDAVRRDAVRRAAGTGAGAGRDRRAAKRVGPRPEDRRVADRYTDA